MTPSAHPPCRWPSLWRRLALAWLVAMVAGCASLPSGVLRPPSMALPASTASTLGRIAAQSQPAPELSGFRLLPVAAFALDTRLQLIRRAERSVDVQYYHIADDEVGHLLLAALRDAALRGVRVRLLIDDLYTENLDPTLLGLAAYPNVEVRLFNPFPGGRDFFLTRFLRSAHEFSRVNRRMHNKLLIADGAMTVTGGRNIANEYFMRNDQANFVDLDTFATGPLVTELAAYFDDYWNSPVVFPVGAIVHSALTPAELQRQFDAITGDALQPEPPPANDVLGYGPIAEDLDAGRLGLVWASATAYADAPGRIKGMGASYALLPLEDVESVRYNVIDLMRRARSEVLMTTPYLVPGEKGMALLAELRSHQVKVRVLTNSLAATDEPLVHIGYKRYREPMLALGVELHELSPVRAKRSKRLGMFRSAQSRLHAKTAVIDRRLIFLGSMNFDPRSEKTNTEMGVFIDSPQLAREMLRLMDLDKLQASYQVMLRPDGQGLQWVASDDEGEVVLNDEPDADRFTQFILKLLAPLAPEELL
jgi:putative cardiolipin synthase